MSQKVTSFTFARVKAQMRGYGKLDHDALQNLSDDFALGEKTLWRIHKARTFHEYENGLERERVRRKDNSNHKDWDNEVNVILYHHNNQLVRKNRELSEQIVDTQKQYRLAGVLWLLIGLVFGSEITVLALIVMGELK